MLIFETKLKLFNVPRQEDFMIIPFMNGSWSYYT